MKGDPKKTLCSRCGKELKANGSRMVVHDTDKRMPSGDYCLPRVGGISCYQQAVNQVEDATREQRRGDIEAVMHERIWGGV